MAPSPEFGLDGKMNQAQKMNNKVEGTPKTESKSKVGVLIKVGMISYRHTRSPSVVMYTICS